MTVLWTPDQARKTQTQLWRFARENGFEPEDYASLHRWSISDPGGFWSTVWDFTGVLGDLGERAFVRDLSAPMTGARFFPEARLNLSENLLMRGKAQDVAVCEMTENGDYREVTRGRASGPGGPRRAWIARRRCDAGRPRCGCSGQ